MCVQSFQQCVCVNSGRVNTLLQRGEALIQHSQPADAQHVESRLLELLRRCSLVYNNVARTHTRLLSMRLVHTHTHTQRNFNGTEYTQVNIYEGALRTHLNATTVKIHCYRGHRTSRGRKLKVLYKVIVIVCTL